MPERRWSRRLLLQAAATATSSLGLAEAGSQPVVIVEAPEGPADHSVVSAIARLSKRGGAKLLFRPGRYVFETRSGAVLAFDSIDDLVVEGQDAELVFAGTATPIMFRNCRAPVLSGLTIDWIRPPFTQGVVTGILDPGRHTIALHLAPEYTLEGVGLVEALLELDPKTGLMRHGATDVYGGLALGPATPDRSVTVSSRRSVEVAVGTTVVLRHWLYRANALYFVDCTGGLTVSDVTVYAAPGMGLYSRKCQGEALLQRLTVTRKPGSGRLLSTNSDAVHFNSFSGSIRIEKCSFAGMGDDAVNVYSEYYRIAQILGPRTLAVERRIGPIGPSEMPNPGTHLQFVAGRDGVPISEARVASARYGSPTVFEFDADLGPSLRAGDLVAEPAGSAHLSVTDCAFSGNRGRGVVAHADTVIERCVFADQSRAAVFLASDLTWLECCEVSRARISDNQIVGACRSMPGAGAIMVNAISKSASSIPVNHDVVLERNRIEAPREHAIRVGRTGRITLLSNHIAVPAKDAIVLEQVEQVTLVGNECSPPSKVRLIDTASSQLSTSGNRGLSVI